MSNASFWVCTDFWVNELGAGWTGGPAGLSVLPSRAFPWRSWQNGRDKSSKFLFPRRCLSSVALARQHRLRSCSSPRIGARFKVVLQLLDRVILLALWCHSDSQRLNVCFSNEAWNRATPRGQQMHFRIRSVSDVLYAPFHKKGKQKE